VTPPTGDVDVAQTHQNHEGTPLLNQQDETAGSGKFELPPDSKRRHRQRSHVKTPNPCLGEKLPTRSVGLGGPSQKSGGLLPTMRSRRTLIVDRRRGPRGPRSHSPSSLAIARVADSSEIGQCERVPTQRQRDDVIHTRGPTMPRHTEDERQPTSCAVRDTSQHLLAYPLPPFRGTRMTPSRRHADRMLSQTLTVATHPERFP
jgi:hypothetical protein